MVAMVTSKDGLTIEFVKPNVMHLTSVPLIRKKCYKAGQKNANLSPKAPTKERSRISSKYYLVCGLNLKPLSWEIAALVEHPATLQTRRLAACIQAVVILRSTSYIAVELNVLHFNTPVI